MAEGLLRDMANKKGLSLEVKSAGTFAMDGVGAAENAILALKELDINISDHKAQSLSRGLVEEADLILTMSRSHKESLLLKYPDIKDKVYLLNEYAFGKVRDIQDPFGRDEYNYKLVRDEILKALENIKWD